MCFSRENVVRRKFWVETERKIKESEEVDTWRTERDLNGRGLETWKIGRTGVFLLSIVRTIIF